MTKILFVDDEPEILAGLRNLLRRQRRRWQMTFALGGEAAIQRLAEESFDIVVSDMRMPGIDGIDVLSEVQQRQPNAARIVLSGYADRDMAIKAAIVAHQFLTKPCDADTLTNVLERACNLQQLIGDETIRRIVGRIDHLPVVPQIYHELTGALSNQNTTARKIAEILEQDMAVCAKLLQMVNSAFFRLARQISAIEEAVAYLGVETIRTLVLSAKIFDTVDPECNLAGLSISALQSHALHVAALSKQIAPPGQEEAAFTAAMLHDIGLLILMAGSPQTLNEALKRADKEKRPLYAVEHELYGTSHAEIGAYLLGIWGLPYPVVEAVANHHQPGRVPQQEYDLVATLHTAQQLLRETMPHCRVCQTEAAAEDTSYWQSLHVAGRLEDWRALAQRIAHPEET